MLQNPEVYSCEHAEQNGQWVKQGHKPQKTRLKTAWGGGKKLPLIEELIKQMSCDWSERSRWALRCTYRTLPHNLISSLFFKYLAAQLNWQKKRLV